MTRHPFLRVFPSGLSPVFIGSDFFTTTGPSAILQAIVRAFLSVIPSLPCAIWLKEPTGLPPVIAPSVPSIPTLNTSVCPAGRFPFRVFPQDARFAQVSPFFRRVALHRRHLWFTYCSGLDFACRPFGFFLAEDTLSTLLRVERGCVLRLRHLKGSYRVDFDHLDGATAGRTKK
jgi:hypothetical protein